MDRLDEETIARHESDIKELYINKKELMKQLADVEREIAQVKLWNKQIKGRC